MSLTKESADAFRQCLRIIAPHYEPSVRRTQVLNVESYIAKGEWIPAWHLKDIARLFYPNDPQRVGAMEAQMLAAMESKELQSSPNNQAFLSGDLVAWIDCPPVPKDSPLRFWLPEWMQESKMPATPSKKEKPILQQQFQEQEIMRVIRDLSYDPKNLPIQEPGKPGVKSEVRRMLSFSPGVFNKAWERLRGNRDIQDAE